MDPEITDQDEPAARGITRKNLLKAALIAAPLPLLIGGVPALARAQRNSGGPLAPTPFCHDGDAPTIDQTEGPYFKPNSPLRSVLTGAGTPLTVSGFVFNRACQPLANVLLDFWQADTNGEYDNVGYTFRGHQFTNAQGAYSLTTVVPGLYPGRTRHLHMKVQAPNRGILTTQTYFPGEPRNNTDTIFDARLLMNVRNGNGGKEATFDFVLNIAGVPPTSQPPTSEPPTSEPPTNPPGGSWRAGTNYAAGATVSYGGQNYRCLQGHTALSGWEPPNVPALWQRI
ncbi:dioxygenase family protein [Embleya hyalina]|uniref:Dioxygenase n=1 Tax=Embleya hyalina TaxID=516124 RepID=A0A401YIU9_9ACTN|nr:carbohydrate-binding protein [Embleya hyalina]GCD94523.1 dioxygenase [Embleya hyalina]